MPRKVKRPPKLVTDAQPGSPTRRMTTSQMNSSQAAPNLNYTDSSDDSRYYTASSDLNVSSNNIVNRGVGKRSCDSEVESRADDEERSNGIIVNMKDKLSRNIEHYSNLFQEITFPILFRRSDTSRHSQHQRENAQRLDDHSHFPNKFHNNDETCEEYPAIESIELYQFNGFVFGSEREKGKGHDFQPLHLSAPTWCDLCGDFIWGVYKQCLQCKRKYLAVLYQFFKSAF